MAVFIIKNMSTLNCTQHKIKEVSGWPAISTQIKIYNYKKFWIMHTLIKRKSRRATLTNRRLSPVLTSGGYGQWQIDRIVGHVTQESWGLSSDASKWQRRDIQNNTAIWHKKAVEPPYNVPHMRHIWASTKALPNGAILIWKFKSWC